MGQKTENIFVGSLMVFTFFIFIYIISNTQNSFGGGDHFNHFSLAYWGWKYPDMLFNHWGKPVFTLLISPFAQFGINGARLYNVIIGLITAFLIWRLAKHFNFNQAWIVIILSLFTPIYFILMFTSLTEVTFSFFLVLAIFLFFKDKYILSSIVLSFLPLVRTEGIVLLPLFILAYSLKRKFWSIPFLGVGFLVISLLGMPYYESFWWLVSEMPYSGSAKDIYGSGPLLHFFNNNALILGDFLGILFLIGIIVMVKKWISKSHFRFDDNFYFILLIIGSFVTFYVAHSYVWWKGMGNSLGLIRVIGSVTPLASLTAMAGLSLIFDIKNKWWTVFAFVLLFIGGYSFIDESTKVHKYGFSISRPQQILTDAAEYIKDYNLDNHKIYYYNGYFSQIMNFDPRENELNQKYLPNNFFFMASVPDSSIIVWDAHFGPNEGRMPLEKLEAQKDIKILKVIKPEKSFKVLGGHEYQVVILQKDISLKPKKRNFYNDFESSTNSTSENVFEGEKSFKLENRFKYKTLLDVIYQEISDTLTTTKVEVDFAYNFPNLIDANQVLLVCTLESNEKVMYNSYKDLLLEKNREKSWQVQSFQFEIPKPKSVNDRIKIYIWNKNEQEVFIDEVYISFR